MITRLLRLLQARSLELEKYSTRAIDWDNGKTTVTVAHTAEKREIDELIKELQTPEIWAENCSKRRKWVTIDTWLPSNCLFVMVHDEELARSEGEIK
jgi:hypothetical protein